MPVTMDFQLTPGPELDRKVANACRLSLQAIASDQPGGMCYALAEGTHAMFCPSADLNAAFEAAGRAGLWRNPKGLASLTAVCSDKHWVVTIDGLGLEKEEVLSRENSAALAICGAILKLRNRDD